MIRRSRWAPKEKSARNAAKKTQELICSPAKWPGCFLMITGGVSAA